MVSRRVRLDLAAAALGWLLPWAAWLAGGGGMLGVAALVVAAFWGTPLLAVPVALLACLTQWGAGGIGAFGAGLADVASGRAIPASFLPHLGLLLGWLGLAWRAAAAASRAATRAGIESELRQGALGWIGLAIAATWAPARLLPDALLGLGIYVAAALDGLALAQLFEFERRFGSLAERRGYRSASGTAIWVVVAGATLAAWILAGGGGILPAFLHLLDQAVFFVLSPVFLVLGYIAQVVLAILDWLLHGKPIQLPKLNAALGSKPPQQHPLTPSPTPLWAVLTGRWLLILAVVAAVAIALALLRARRPEPTEAAGFSEERSALGDGGAPAPPRSRGRSRGPEPDLAIRRLFRRWLEIAADRGRGRRPQETAREHFGRVLAGDADLTAAARPLLDGYERGRYGGGGGDAAELAAAEGALERIRRDWRPEAGRK
jgi:hypothetical protein